MWYTRASHTCVVGSLRCRAAARRAPIAHATAHAALESSVGIRLCLLVVVDDGGWASAHGAPIAHTTAQAAFKGLDLHLLGLDDGSRAAARRAPIPHPTAHAAIESSIGLLEDGRSDDDGAVHKAGHISRTGQPRGRIERVSRADEGGEEEHDRQHFFAAIRCHHDHRWSKQT